MDDTALIFGGLFFLWSCAVLTAGVFIGQSMAHREAANSEYLQALYEFEVQARRGQGRDEL